MVREVKKAAVIIGVGKTGGLVPLKSPVPGAKRVADWLKGEGFEVQCLTDEFRPVIAGEVKRAIKSFVTLPPRLNLLVVYFSGHGYWYPRSDQWLLSQAPTEPDEAINVRSAMNSAKRTVIRILILFRMPVNLRIPSVELLWMGFPRSRIMKGSIQIQRLILLERQVKRARHMRGK